MNAVRPWWEPIAVVCRWIVFIPGGLLGALLGGLAIQIIGAMTTGFTGQVSFAPFMAAAAVGFLSIFCAVRIAPTENALVPAIAMTMVMSLLYGVAILINIGESEWLETVRCGITLAAVAYTLHLFILESHKPVATPLPEVKTESLREKYPALFEDDDSSLADLESEDDEAESPLVEAVHA